MHPLEDYFDAEGDELPPSAHPYGWVPIGPGELKATVRPSSGHMQTKSATVLPLEYYDNPEMELVAPEKKLEEVGLGRVGMGREGSAGMRRQREMEPTAAPNARAHMAPPAHPSGGFTRKRSGAIRRVET